MKIKNVSKEQIFEALDKTNEDYGGNIVFDRPQPYCKEFTVEKSLFEDGEIITHGVYQINLWVADTSASGHSVTASGRRSHWACWHAYGDFFDNLLTINPEAVIITCPPSSGRRVITREGGNWQDYYKRGGLGCGGYASELCECERGAW